MERNDSTSATLFNRSRNHLNKKIVDTLVARTRLSAALPIVVLWLLSPLRLLSSSSALRVGRLVATESLEQTLKAQRTMLDGAASMSVTGNSGCNSQRDGVAARRMSSRSTSTNRRTFTFGSAMTGQQNTVSKVWTTPLHFSTILRSVSQTVS